MITQKQKDVAARVCQHIKNAGGAWREQIRKNVQKENEYMAKKEKAQRPTRKQMETPYDI